MLIAQLDRHGISPNRWSVLLQMSEKRLLDRPDVARKLLFEVRLLRHEISFPALFDLLHG